MKNSRKQYESPFTRKQSVELEDNLCAASYTETPVINEKNNKVEIEEQGHGTWDGLGDDINADWE